MTMTYILHFEITSDKHKHLFNMKSCWKLLRTTRSSSRANTQQVGPTIERLREDLSNVDRKKLSTDQQYLLEIYNGIIAGECSTDLSIQNPGCLNHS